METFVCKYCGEIVDSSHNSDVVVCVTCGTVNYRRETPIPFPRKTKRGKPQQAIPYETTLEQLPDGLAITIRWRGCHRLGCAGCLVFLRFAGYPSNF